MNDAPNVAQLHEISTQELAMRIGDSKTGLVTASMVGTYSVLGWMRF